MTNKDFRAKIFEAFSLDKKARKNVRRLFHSLLDVLLNICFGNRWMRTGKCVGKGWEKSGMNWKKENESKNE